MRILRRCSGRAGNAGESGKEAARGLLAACILGDESRLPLLAFELASEGLLPAIIPATRPYTPACSWPKEAVMAATSAIPAPELTLNIEKSPAQTTVHCTGRVTARSSELLLNTVRPLIPETKRVVLDLSHLEYLDSSGLGTIVRLWMTGKKANCELKVVNLSPRIKDLFTLTNISSIFEGVEHSGM